MTWPFGTRGDSPPEDGRPSFEKTVLPHLDAAYSLARWLVRDAHLAEDVLQDAVVRSLTYFASFRGGDSRTWLLRIVRNAAYSALAARQQSLRHLDMREDATEGRALDVPDPGASPETMASSIAEGVTT